MDETKNVVFLQSQWELSSVGSEHLPYKQGVAGSNPTVPTLKIKELEFVLTPCLFNGEYTFVEFQCWLKSPVLVKMRMLGV